MQTGYGHVTGIGVAIQNLHTPLVHVAWYSVIAQARQCTCSRRELDNHYCTCTGYDTHTYTLQSHITHTNAWAREEP